MVQPTLTALALMFILGHETVPAAILSLQASPSTPEPEDRALVTTAPMTQPTAIAETDNTPFIPDEVTQPDTRTASPVTDDIASSPSPVLRVETRGNLEPAPTIPAAAPVTRHEAGTLTYTVLLERARLALSSAKTAKGRFTQTNADGSLYSGTFAISRPGKLRFEYDAPVPVLIVSDGATVAMEDRDLETIDRVPLGSTPLGLILDDQLEFTNDVIVTDVSETPS